MSDTFYRDAALADGRSPRLRHGVGVLVADGRIEWIRPVGGEGELPAGPRRSAERPHRHVAGMAGRLT